MALKNNPHLDSLLDFVASLRLKGCATPLVLMSYLNPVFHIGFKKFCARAILSGLNGVIFPDLPVEEAKFWLKTTSRQLDTVFLVSPLTTDERLEKINKVASGFIYCLSVLGTTGAREGLSPNLLPYLQRVKAKTRLPTAVGFGFSTASQVEKIKGYVDGVVIGSALIDAYDQGRNEKEAVSLLKKKISEVKKAL